jgi:hypothetical protein
MRFVYAEGERVAGAREWGIEELSATMLRETCLQRAAARTLGEKGCGSTVRENCVDRLRSVVHRDAESATGVYASY